MGAEIAVRRVAPLAADGRRRRASGTRRDAADRKEAGGGGGRAGRQKRRWCETAGPGAPLCTLTVVTSVHWHSTEVGAANKLVRLLPPLFQSRESGTRYTASPASLLLL